MDIPTRNLSRYIKEKGINVSKMSRDTGIGYVALYDSLMNSERARDLRAGEMFTVCAFLGVNPMDFADEADEMELAEYGLRKPDGKEAGGRTGADNNPPAC